MIRLVAMGVAGSGKSTLGAAVAQALGCRFVEGDDYHLPASQRKMHAGIALDDADRLPWLDAIVGVFAAEPSDLVVACSALKRSYRDRLRAGVPGLGFVHVDIDRAEAARRVGSRPAHLFPVTLVDSQFAALEPPAGEERVLVVPATDPTAEQVNAVLNWLGRAPP